MATNVPLLAYLTKHAQEEFPDAFEIVASPGLYTFKSQTLEKGLSVDMVLVGLYDVHQNTKGRKPLWACVKSDNVQYYYEKSTQLSQLDGDRELYPKEGTVRHKDGPAPFNLVAPSRWHSIKDVKHDERRKARARLEHLVRFAYILTGRTHSMGDGSHAYVLGQLRRLCMDLLENANNERKATAKCVVDSEVRAAQSMEDQLFEERARYSMPLQLDSTWNKRPADEMEGIAVEQGVRNIRNRITDMSLSPPPCDRFSRYPPALQPAHLSVEPQNIYENLVESIMAQKKEEWAKEKAALQGHIDALQAQLVDEQKKSREGDEWKKNYQFLAESLEGLTHVAVQKL